MATVSKRRRKIGLDSAGRTVYKAEGWQVRYVDPDGIERTKAGFKLKKDADDFASDVEVAKRRGEYVSPMDAKRPFREYAEHWRQVQVQWRPGTADTNYLRLKNYVYPVLGDMPIGSIRRTDVQAMVKAAQQSMNGRRVDGEAQPLAITTIHAIAAAAQAVFLAAVEDKVIAASPANKLALPRLGDDDDDDEGEVVPLTFEQFRDFEAALPARWRIAAWLGVGTGLRIGESCGLTEDRIDFLRRRELRVNRQMLRSGVFGPPKSKASRRTIPVSDELLTRLTAHLIEFGDVDRDRRLVLTGERGGPARNGLAEAVTVAARAAGMSERQRFHALRHTYASKLISQGMIKVAQKRLGHATIQETLDTYGHLLPEDDDRSRAVIDAALREFSIGPASDRRGVVRDV